MENALFIGNGLNLCLSNGISWNNLLQEMALRFGVKSNCEIPMPLEFERLINLQLEREWAKASDSIYVEEKKKIAKSIPSGQIDTLSVHYRIINIPVSAVITTNYDINLECCFGSAYQSIQISTSTKYLMQKTGTAGNVSFFHPHGIVSRPATMCLGYEHYLGIVEKMRVELHKTDESRNKIISALSESRDDKYSLKDNIAIIGLGLYQCEIDLWWLLTQRASWYYSNYHGLRKLIKNQIIYYDVIDDIRKTDPKEEEERSRKFHDAETKQQLLNGLFVNVRWIKLSEVIDNTYEAAYRSIFDHLQKSWCIKTCRR